MRNSIPPWSSYWRHFARCSWTLGAVCFAAAAVQSTADTPPPDPPRPGSSNFASFPKRAPFTYPPSPRDPFVDASVKSTLVGDDAASEADTKRFHTDKIAEKLQSEILRLCKISGIVCSEHDGTVLIGRHILRTGDDLQLPLEEKVLSELRELDKAYSLGWGDLLDQEVIPLAIDSIAADGISLSICPLDSSLSLPFSKANSLQSPPAPLPTPK